MDDFLGGIPDFDATPEAVLGICPLGRHDFTVTESAYSKSKSSGNPMVTMKMTVDNGPNAGHSVVEYFVFAERNGRNWGAEKLKSLCVAAGYSWRKQGLSMEEFGDQFVGLRANIDVQHSRSILDGMTWKDKISKEEFDAWDGDKNEKAQINGRGGFKPPVADAVLVFGAKAEAPPKVELEDMF